MFATDGYLKIERAAPREVADAARALLWRQLGLSPDDPGSWTEPVRWAADMTGAGPFGELARSPKLAAALDDICGPGGWLPLGALGNIPVRFPVSPPDDDRGWHIDANTPLPDGSWAVTGRPHTVLVLTLLSEVGPDDAPTRIRVGSHHDVARVLGPEPVELAEMGRLVDEASAARPVTYATGSPGDMYLLHPFTAHAADEHRGSTPRFMAQSPVMLTASGTLDPCRPPPTRWR
ncbi:phytanoyl-CoA dioxygenase family protein [Mycolicibacterium flavescens]|uniref:Mitomycin antibiotics/polyketide fumonisin biosynthesis protein n=1 Tax=Mycolicibacterium flavescens TaxID=1776 RepID=A0A1E3RQ58_MYCFV|nr:phytanoyl-CoA dioxygenase family protein [Mycolicibacterium flavescens]MCV7279402.1 phytanoyl-CoA dioxygenase family protein [Mycolicibacterium flavescens]ODQ91989.1 mitomycin antibiotics/polyketide fumonisin biosynthesis protein [Mycolicibacterium flavescens]